MSSTQVKLIRFERISQQKSLVFVGRVVKTNATLLFEMKPGWLLHAKEGDLVTLSDFETKNNTRLHPHGSWPEVSFSPLLCQPVLNGNFGCGLGVPDPDQASSENSKKRDSKETTESYVYVEPQTKRYRPF